MAERVNVLATVGPASVEHSAAADIDLVADHVGCLCNVVE